MSGLLKLDGTPLTSEVTLKHSYTFTPQYNTWVGKGTAGSAGYVNQTLTLPFAISVPSAASVLTVEAKLNLTTTPLTTNVSDEGIKVNIRNTIINTAFIWVLK